MLTKDQASAAADALATPRREQLEQETLQRERYIENQRKWRRAALVFAAVTLFFSALKYLQH